MTAGRQIYSPLEPSRLSNEPDPREVQIGACRLNPKVYIAYAGFDWRAAMFV